MAEKEQAIQAKLTNTVFKNITLQQPKTAPVDTANTSNENNVEVTMFNNKGKGKGKGKGKQELVPEPQPSMAGNQEKSMKKDQILQAANNSMLGVPPNGTLVPQLPCQG
jgi:hypothetical protein